MYFRIMQVTPTFRSHEADREQQVTGQEGVLLRLLFLRRGNPMSSEDIAAHLTRTGTAVVGAKSIPGYVGRLRDKVGYDAVRTASGYASSVADDDVDAFLFERGVKASGVCELDDIDDVDEEFTEKYSELLALYAMWQANPALMFADEQDDELLFQTYHEFEDYWTSLKLGIIFAELRSRRKARISKAIGRLELMLRRDPEDEQLWSLLVRAHASLPSRDTELPELIGRINDQYADALPHELAYVVDRVRKGHRDVVFPVEWRKQNPKERRELDELVQTLGISSASALELRRSKMEPLECISQTISRLWFCGILATKWVADAYTRSELEKLLERLDNNNGSVRFLVIDPESDGYRRFKELRWGDEDMRSVTILQDLAVSHPCFEIRMYDALPTFRMVLIDQSIMSFSPYLLVPGIQRSRSGWDAPHVVLDRTAPWALAHTFDTLFNEMWGIARPLPPQSHGGAP